MALTANVESTFEAEPWSTRLVAPLLCLVAGLALGTMIGAVPLKILALAVAGAVGIILALGFPYVGGCLFVCALVSVTDADANYDQIVWPIRDISKIPGLPSALWSFFLLLFGGSMFRLYFIRQGCSRLSLRYLAIYVGILLFATAVGLTNGWPIEGMHAESFRFLYPVMFFYLALHLFDRPDRIRRALWLMFAVATFTAAVLGGYYLAGRGVVFALDGVDTSSRIVTDDSGILMTFTAMLLLALAHVMSGQVRWMQSVCLALGCIPLVFAVLFSFRRTVWIGAAGGLLVLWLFATRAERRRLLRFVAPVIPVLLLVFGILACQTGAMNLSGNLVGRFNTLLNPQQSSNRYHAFESLQTLKDIARQPFTGLGLAARHSPLPQYPNSGVPRNVVHNAWLFIWMKLGLPGLLALVWVFIRYLRQVAGGLRPTAHAVDRPILQALAALVPSWVMSSVTGPMPWYPRETMQVALFSALALNLVYLGRSAAGQPNVIACASRR